MTDTEFLSEKGDQLSLTQEGASHFAKLALNCIQQEYPNKLSHVMHNEEEIQSPQALHPAFYGCFDWHSSVHGHWMLIRLLKTFPDMPEALDIRSKIDHNLQEKHIAQEVAYLNQSGRKSFERMYGWAWLLKLAEELHGWNDPQAQNWSRQLQPLTDAIIARYLDFLPRQTYPIRTGVHPNTAFGLSFAWDYAQAANHEALKRIIRESSLRYYGFDVNCPATWEPGGSDFLSPCLEEANLMRRVLEAEAFTDWFSRFLPDLPASLREPATVSDRTDGQIVHLDGLNLSRSWCFYGIASSLPESDPRGGLLREVAEKHVRITLPNIASGNYEGEHWLASFAVYVLSMTD
ncbi:MAG: DUF2891 domain-containing protein [Bacteroidota bacterium]